MDELDCNAITEWLWVGACPRTPQDVLFLRNDLGVRGVLNVQSDADLVEYQLAWKSIQAAYIRERMVLRRVAVRDGDPQDLARHLDHCVRELHDLRTAGHKVYLHCTFGVNRSPTVAIAYLYQFGAMSVEQATDHVQTRRPCFPYPSLLRDIARLVPRPADD